MIPTTEPEMSKFAEQLGLMLMRLPLVSGAAGHKWVTGTICDYVRATGPETEFLLDLFSHPIPEVLLKWYPQIKTPDGDLLFKHPACQVVSGPGSKEMKMAMKAAANSGFLKFKHLEGASHA